MKHTSFSSLQSRQKNFCRLIMTINLPFLFQQRVVNHMTGAYGRVRTCKVIVGVGNGNGSFGYAMSSAKEPRPAVKRALNRAAQRLLYVPRFEDRTSTCTIHL